MSKPRKLPILAPFFILVTIPLSFTFIHFHSLSFTFVYFHSPSFTFTHFQFSSIHAHIHYKCSFIKKAGYTATPVACGWAGAVLEEVTRAFGQKQFVRKLKDAEKVKTRHRPFGAAAPKRANSERFRDRAEQKRNKGEQSALLSEQTNCLSAMESKQSRRIEVEKNKRK